MQLLISGILLASICLCECHFSGTAKLNKRIHNNLCLLATRRTFMLVLSRLVYMLRLSFATGKAFRQAGHHWSTATLWMLWGCIY